MEGETDHPRLSGLETWFVLPGQEVVIPPPRWKMAIITFFGVWPASIFVPLVVNPFFGRLYWLLPSGLINIGIVVLLTWLIMPLLVRALKPWL
jgi:antibiotic biosynthesis monooxygenase (ABM) superfamily enzyme